jgi:hypothetical protein
MEEIDFSKLKSYSELQAEQESETPEKVPEEGEGELEEELEEEEDAGEPVESEAPEEKPAKTKVAEAPWGKPGKVPKGLQDRFKKLTTEIAGLKAQVAAQGTKTQDKKEETFDLSNPQELARYIELQVEMRTSAEAEARAEQAKIQKDFDALNETWTKNFEQARADLIDYDDVLANSEAVLPKQTLRYIVASDVGAYVSYTIAKNPDLQTEINSMSPEGRHAKVLEVEKTVRAFLKGRAKPAAASPAPQKPGSVPTKPVLKVPGASVKKTAGKSANIDWATASMDEVLGL